MLYIWCEAITTGKHVFPGSYYADAIIISDDKVVIQSINHFLKTTFDIKDLH